MSSFPTSPSSPSLPLLNIQDSWVVHKFGGTSLASSECYRNVLRLLINLRAEQRKNQSSTPSLNHRICVVVSAMGEIKPASQVGKLISTYHQDDPKFVVNRQDKVTNLLIKCTELAAANDPHYKQIFEDLKKRHLNVVEELINEQIIHEYAHLTLNNDPSSPVNNGVTPSYSHADHGEETFSALSLALLHLKETLRSALFKDFDDLSYILRACWLSRAYDLEHNWWFGYGELWSARLLCTFLNAVLLTIGEGPGRSNERGVWLDARDVLVLARTKEPMPDFQISQEKFDQWLKSSIQISTASIIVVTGYIASSPTGIPTTLGRDGSDYSASIFAALLRANHVVIWTDVDGVYSANPATVPTAVLLDELSYDEASELAYFGAKVLHPKTMTPVLAQEIPIWIKNTFRDDCRGSCILSRRIIAQKQNSNKNKLIPFPTDASDVEIRVGVAYGVKGFSEISNLCLIEVKGTGVIGVPGIASRLFSRLKEANCQVILVTQAGSELSMCIAIPMSQSEVGMTVLNREFRDELMTKEIVSIERNGPCACLAVVGDGMRSKRGVAGRVFGALADAGVNVIAIAQGSSERNISALIAQADVNRAVLAVHNAFLTPSGIDSEYSPLLKGKVPSIEERPIDSITKSPMLGPLVISTANNIITSPLLKSSAIVPASPAHSLVLGGTSDSDSDERVNNEDTNVRELRRIYSVFTRDIFLEVCLIISTGCGWSNSEIEILKEKLSVDWGQRKEVKVSINHIIDIHKQTMIIDNDANNIQPLDWSTLTTLFTNTSAPNTYPVVIDCTTSEMVLRRYKQWIKLGIRLITQRQLLSPLAALHSIPLYATLYDLQQRKETITRIEAILPSPLTFAFSAPKQSRVITIDQVKSSYASVRHMMKLIALACGITDVEERSNEENLLLAANDGEVERIIKEYRNNASNLGQSYQLVASLAINENEAITASSLSTTTITTPPPASPSISSPDSIQRTPPTNLDPLPSRSLSTLDVTLRLCPPTHPFAWLRGYSSSISIYTTRYNTDPIVLSGPVNLNQMAVMSGHEVEKERWEENEENLGIFTRASNSSSNTIASGGGGKFENLDHAIAQFAAIVSDLAK